jgi:two-component system chemotaxis sensor kinase CheA
MLRGILLRQETQDAYRQDRLMSENEEFVREFLVESAENLDQLDRDLVALEENPHDSKRLASIFRAVHTIKGTSGFFGFAKLGAITHSGEHLLGQLRDGKIDLDDQVTGALLTLVDAVRSILDQIEQTGNEGENDFNDLSQTLSRVAEEAAIHRSKAGDVVITRLTPPAPQPVAPPVPAAVAVSAAETDSPAQSVEAADSEPVVPEPASFPPIPAQAPPAAVIPAAAPVEAPAAERAPPAPPAAAARLAPIAEQSIRVDVGLLGSLVDLVGELVLARNQLQSTVNRSSATDGQPELLKVVHRIDTVTAALQATAMKTRMQSIDQVFSKFPRIVRDLAVTCRKEVQLVIDGADTELDRSLIETIRDPLTHLLRNAVDHGIETPAARIAKGKPAAGRLQLRAFHESGQVTVEIQDDGGGIPVEAVRRKAVARGLVSEEEAALMPNDRVLQFIFEPGFSTAAQVTDVSGRGVGMDVVKTNIESIGGTVDIASQPDIGTTVRVRIPLTLAIIPALIISSTKQRFAIPQAYVRELISLHTGRTPAVVEGLDGGPVMRLRGRLLPLVYLDATLGLASDTAAGGTVVVLSIDDYEFGLVVDSVAVSEEIVVKPIAGVLVSLGLYAGATVRGDGAVVLILDPRGIAQAAKLSPRSFAAQPAGDQTASALALPRYLLCETAAGRVVALPLEDVSRLESFGRDRIQQAAGRTVVNREGRLTPIADVEDVLLGRSAPIHAPQFTAVILADSIGEMGLRVKRILEVVEPEIPLNLALRTQGVLGTIAVGGQATEVVDVRSALAPFLVDLPPQVPA